jgi:hypothetical protein
MELNSSNHQDIIRHFTESTALIQKLISANELDAVRVAMDNLVDTVHSLFDLLSDREFDMSLFYELLQKDIKEELKNKLKNPDNQIIIDKGFRKPIVVFMAMPYQPAYNKIEQAARLFFEGIDCAFTLRLAKDVQFHGDVRENISTHLRLADAFISVIDEHNPGVMLETGYAIFNQTSRPVIILKSEDMSTNIHEDLRGLIFVEYAAEGKSAEEIHDQIKKSLVVNGRFRDKRFENLKNNNIPTFSKTLLSSRDIKIILNPEQINFILSEYKFIVDFINASTYEIKKCGLTKDEISVLKQNLKKML